MPATRLMKRSRYNPLSLADRELRPWQEEAVAMFRRLGFRDEEIKEDFQTVFVRLDLLTIPVCKDDECTLPWGVLDQRDIPLFESSTLEEVEEYLRVKLRSMIDRFQSLDLDVP